MPRICELSGHKKMFGNNVSHSNRKTRRCFNVNLSLFSVKSDALRKEMRFKISNKTKRTIDKHGGIDGYLSTRNAKDLTPMAQRLRRQVKKSLSAASA